MNIKYKVLETQEEAERASEFLLHEENFGQILSENEEKLVSSEPLKSLSNEKQQFWLAINQDDKIIGVIGVNENFVGTDGYYLDWFAVESEYRSKGIGRELIKLAEEFVKVKRGRYLTIDTGDNDKYAKARKFYISAGYTQVGHVPQFFHKNCGRIDYYKEFTY